MSARRLLLMDVAVLAVYLVCANPAITGIPAHEWLGIAVFLVFAAHLFQHAAWVMDAAKSAFRAPGWARTGNLIMDALVLLAFGMVTVSDVMVSGSVLQALGLYATGYFFWDPIHAVSAKALLALLLVHVVAHWRWVAGAARKGKDSNDD